jgi:hypothetical protein
MEIRLRPFRSINPVTYEPEIKFITYDIGPVLRVDKPGSAGSDINIVIAPRMYCATFNKKDK